MKPNEINNYCLFCDDAFTTLLDVYQMKDWGVSWKEFIHAATAEFNSYAERWEREKVDEEDE